eukprot:1288387-Pleurochrysis_carterae.AAC.1
MNRQRQPANAPAHTQLARLPQSVGCLRLQPFIGPELRSSDRPTSLLTCARRCVSDAGGCVLDAGRALLARAA